MKYENAQRVKSLLNEIKKAEGELANMVESKENSKMRIIIVADTKTMYTIGVGDFEHQFTKHSNIFIEDLIQITRDNITKLVGELESL